MCASHSPVSCSTYIMLSIRKLNMDYSLCKALSYNMEDMPVALVMYDIMCQYGVHLKARVESSPELSLPNSLEPCTGIGLLHIHGHQNSCSSHFSPSYISGAKQVDGEIIETLWAPTTQSHLSEHLRDVHGSSPGGARCSYESFQLEKDDIGWAHSFLIHSYC